MGSRQMQSLQPAMREHLGCLEVNSDVSVLKLKQQCVSTRCQGLQIITHQRIRINIAAVNHKHHSIELILNLILR